MSSQSVTGVCTVYNIGHVTKVFFFLETRVGLIQMGDTSRFEMRLSGNATAVSEAAGCML